MMGFNQESIHVFGHLAYGLILTSFIVKQMLLLRIFSVVASLSSIFYNYHLTSSPIWIPIQWNILFILVNAYHIFMHLSAKRKIPLTDIEHFVHSKNFPTMTTVEFKRLLSSGHTRTYHKGQKLIEENSQLGAIFLIMEGEVQVCSKGKVISSLSHGEFIGEMSFLTGQMTKTDIILTTTSKIHYWDLDDLDNFFRKYPLILSKFHSAIGTQLISRMLQKEDVMACTNNELPFKKAA